jgi:hypothetical protein
MNDTKSQNNILKQINTIHRKTNSLHDVIYSKLMKSLCMFYKTQESSAIYMASEEILKMAIGASKTAI